jgi:hypothetical protein
MMLDRPGVVLAFAPPDHLQRREGQAVFRRDERCRSAPDDSGPRGHEAMAYYA